MVDRWQSGDAYDPYVGRWSQRVAVEFVQWLGRHGAVWTDVGCGTGALTGAILQDDAARLVLAFDASIGYVKYARRKLSGPGAVFSVADARSLPQRSATADVVVSGLMINFIADKQRVVEEFRRITRPGGVVAAYVWDYAEGMQLMRHFWDAAVALDPAAAALDEGRRFPICRPAPLEQLFRSAGLQNVEVRPIEVETRFSSFDDYWSPFLGGQGPAPGYAVGLPESARAQLRERLRAALPAGPDGCISLIARAWAVKGSVPVA